MAYNNNASIQKTPQVVPVESKLVKQPRQTGPLNSNPLLTNVEAIVNKQPRYTGPLSANPLLALVSVQATSGAKQPRVDGNIVQSVPLIAVMKEPRP